MPMTTSDRIIAPSRGSAATAEGFAKRGGAARPPDCTEYIRAVYDLCRPDDLPDASIVIAQSLQETTDGGKPWNSAWWRTRLNPAGMGITGDPQENAQSPTFASGTEAARAQVSHLLLYATGQVDRGGLTPRDDPRYKAYVDAYGHAATATTIEGLAGTWAVDPHYDTGIVARGNACFRGLPDQGGGPVADVVFGRVPFPSCQIRDIGTPPNTAWDNLGTRTMKSVVWHRMLGSLTGTDTYFRGEGAGRALTDYGMGVAAQDGASLAGVLYRWNDPTKYRSPWSSGPVSDPYGDGAAFVNLYGVNAVNRDTTSLEISGFQQTPLDDKARAMIAAFTAYYADQYKVSYQSFPKLPKEGGRSFVIWHTEFTRGTGKLCPFDVVQQETDALIARTRSLLERYQTAEKPGPAPGEYPDHRVPIKVTSQGFTLVATCPNRYECTQGTTLRTYPHRDAPAAGSKPAQAGRTYTFDFSATVNNEPWLVSKSGSWALRSAFEQEV